MPDWDEDSTALRENLQKTLRDIAAAAKRRERPSIEDARRWHTSIMAGLDVPEPQYVGWFRGEAGLEDVEVTIDDVYGVNSAAVAEALARFEEKLQGVASQLDGLLPAGQELDGDQLAAVIDLCAWAHAGWVRIHPFANGNGRTARLWANSLAMRYGLPPFVRLRPRPNSGYAAAGASAMAGDWDPTAAVFRELLNETLKG